MDITIREISAWSLLSFQQCSQQFPELEHDFYITKESRREMKRVSLCVMLVVIVCVDKVSVKNFLPRILA